MITSFCQRWRQHYGVYRLAGEHFDPRALEVFAMRGDNEPKAFVEAHHYSRSYPPARRRFGLHMRFVGLVGVAVFSQPMKDEVLRPWGRDVALELGRLVLLDEVESNAESWFVRRALDLLRREGFAGVVSHSDPEPRRDAEGRYVFAGHVGTVYQSLGAAYTGRASRRTMRLLDDGREFSNRAASKLRKGERGRRYAMGQLLAAGAREPAPSEDLAAWYRAEVARLTRPQPHPGNHRFVFALTEGAKRDLAREPSLSYPKFNARACRAAPNAAEGCVEILRETGSDAALPPFRRDS